MQNWFINIFLTVTFCLFGIGFDFLKVLYSFFIPGKQVFGFSSGKLYNLAETIQWGQHYQPRLSANTNI